MSDQETGKGRSSLGPFHIITGLILLFGVFLTVYRFTQGLGPMTNLSHEYPWGLWIGFDLLCGVALAAGGFVTTAACYIFGLKKYHIAVRPAVLTAMLGYLLVVIALTYDVGRPWRLPYPFVVQSGTTSVLFEVALCVMIYLLTLIAEYSQVAFEWLRMSVARSMVMKVILFLTVLGVILSTMHQSSLGALYLIAPSKMHPLWYSAYIPVYFFVSSIVAGLSMVIVEMSLARRFMRRKMDEAHERGYEDVVLGFGKAAAFVLAGYVSLKVLGLAVENDWGYLVTGFGGLFLIELLGFFALPAYVFAVAARERRVGLVKWTALWAVLGIVLNRINVSLIAYNWNLSVGEHYFPGWMEFGLTIFIVTLGLVLYRYCVTRMPVLYEHPEYTDTH
ncbi:MAG: Ni/Fe-hydrogenase cytochrome b subunit [Desulfohalobiaceae bacterium]|nr:Ni/Fe-hydrogenase cytochrome b subunit [Desulfohalobiaceae bacterium]